MCDPVACHTLIGDSGSEVGVVWLCRNACLSILVPYHTTAE
jgi:hypothetical protein